MLKHDFGDFTHDLIGMEDFSNAAAFSKTWLLVITQILQGIRIDSNAYSLVDIFSIMSPDDNLDVAVRRLEIEVGADADNSVINQYLKHQLAVLIQSSNDYSPDIFSDTVSALIWANHLFRSDICPFAEIPWMICLYQFKSGKQTDYSEVILHHLNEIGYPYHGSASALPTIQLCIDLIGVPQYDGFFYSNDIKVLVDTVMRELQNIPDDDSLQYSVRNMYLNLLEAIVTQSAWKRSSEKYKLSEMLEECQGIFERIGIPKAAEVASLLSDL